jgi:hypothetical protein
MVGSESQLRKTNMNMPNNEQEAWAEILKARDTAAAAKTENEKALSQLNLARAELHYEIIITVAQFNRFFPSGIHPRREVRSSRRHPDPSSIAG